MSTELTGRELDAAVASQVMGTAFVDTPFIPNAVSPTAMFTDEAARLWRQVYPYSIAVSTIPRYSTDIAAAMEVIAKLEKDNMIVLAHMANLPSEELWSVSLSLNAPGYIDVRGEAKTLPEAICRAALATVSEESK